MLADMIEAISKPEHLLSILSCDYVGRHTLKDMAKLTFLDDPPRDENVTAYDQEHVGLYLRLLDAEAQRANWRDVVKVIFGLDPASDYGRAQRVYDNHLARARLLAASGHRDFLSRGSKMRG